MEEKKLSSMLTDSISMLRMSLSASETNIGLWSVCTVGAEDSYHFRSWLSDLCSLTANHGQDAHNILLQRL
jgi:hypothetical protein